jgi:NAD(P)-dependent dehydrogenase (short-subunit alcohol dehydrogenase family)
MDKSKVLRLEDSGVLIAGGSSGIGLATAVRFAESGVGRMALVGRNPERGAQAKAAIAARFPRVQVEFLAADLVDAAQAKRAGETAERLIGGVDVLVNSVNSGGVPELFHDSAIESIQPTVANLLLPPLHMCSAVLPGMRRRGRGAIVNIASDAAKTATPGEAAIGAAMAGIVRFTLALALEAKRYGVRVNAVTPSLTKGTDSYKRIMANEFAGKLFQKAERAALLGVPAPEDYAPLIVFLAGPDAALITGQAVSLNGGVSVG